MGNAQGSLVGLFMIWWACLAFNSGRYVYNFLRNTNVFFIAEESTITKGNKVLIIKVLKKSLVRKKEGKNII